MVEFHRKLEQTTYRNRQLFPENSLEEKLNSPYSDDYLGLSGITGVNKRISRTKTWKHSETGNVMERSDKSITECSIIWKDWWQSASVCPQCPEALRKHVVLFKHWPRSSSWPGISTGLTPFIINVYLIPRRCNSYHRLLFVYSAICSLIPRCYATDIS